MNGVLSEYAFLYTHNNPPTANAGSDQSIRAGDVVTLDGSGSFDDNTPAASLLYAWSFDSIPVGSAAVLNNADTQTPDFVADVAGTYVIGLIVTDENSASSTADFVQVSSNNLAPTADISVPDLEDIGERVLLDGSGSIDPEGDAITYQWSILNKPVGSTATLASIARSRTSFVPDFPGDYLFELEVSDFVGTGVPAFHTVTIAAPEDKDGEDGEDGGDHKQSMLSGASAIVRKLPDYSITSAGNKAALLSYISNAVQEIQRDKTSRAVTQLWLALVRTDGCINHGSPDMTGPERDWIKSCAKQKEIYNALHDALAATLLRKSSE